MSKLRNFKRKLKVDKIMLAEQTHYEQIKLLRQIVAERASKDNEFAKELLQVIGDVLPPEIKKSAEDCVANFNKSVEESNQPVVAEPRGDSPIINS